MNNLPPEHLIIVPGHAPLKQEVNPDQLPANIDQDQHWSLQSFQNGEPPYYIEHIKAGVEQLKDDPLSVLMFSGGRTRPEAGQWSEAASYLAVAGAHNFWAANQEAANYLAGRIVTEEHARDSLENLRFSMGLFYQQHHQLPSLVTVIGWGFKAPRFDLHRQALEIPAHRFVYRGVNDPVDLDAAQAGEARARQQFEQDPLSETSILYDKKQQRNPQNRPIPYHKSELLPDIAHHFPENQLRRSA